jgi:lysophospholipid acyltransferase (LPLAT)-like uncharacterized protein
MTAVGDLLFRLLVGTLGRSWRVRPVGREHLCALQDHGSPFIYALWHAHLLPLAWLHRGSRTTLVVSHHRDGRRFAAAARSWGYDIIDGSSTRGGTKALRQMVRVLRSGGEVALTPDGPRGPVRAVKGGLISAAKLAGVPILPVGTRVSSAWRLRSWDGFVIPKPFATVEIVYGAPIRVERDAGRIEPDGERLRVRLDALSGAATC